MKKSKNGKVKRVRTTAEQVANVETKAQESGLKLNWIDANNYVVDRVGTPKASLSHDGKLLFNNAAIALMDIEKDDHVLIAANEEGNGFYVVPTTDDDDRAFRVGKANKLMVNLRPVLDEMGVGYEKYIHSYNVSKVEAEDATMIVFECSFDERKERGTQKPVKKVKK